MRFFVVALFAVLSSSVAWADPEPVVVSQSVIDAMPVTPENGKYHHPQDPVKFRRWAFLFMLTRIADAYTTNTALAQGGREVDPLAVRLVQNPAECYAVNIASGFLIPMVIKGSRGYDWHAMEDVTIVSGIAPLWNITQIRW